MVWTDDQIRLWQQTGVRPVVAIWTAAQTAQFLRGIAGHRLYAAYHLIALRGLRRGEAAGLRWCDLDLNNCRQACPQRHALRTGFTTATQAGPTSEDKSLGGKSTINT